MSEPDCIFCKIARGEIPAKMVYQDGEMMAFHDIRPEMDLHLLLVPKQHIESLSHARSEDLPLLGRMLGLAPKLAAEHGYSDGFRTRIHTGRAGGQEVFHLHFHLLAGKRKQSV